MPYELWTSYKRYLSVWKPWGYAAYVHDPFHKHGKLGQKGKKNIFIRYSEQSKGYVFLSEHKSESITEFESKDVAFLKNEFLQ